MTQKILLIILPFLVFSCSQTITNSLFVKPINKITIPLPENETPFILSYINTDYQTEEITLNKMDFYETEVFTNAINPITIKSINVESKESTGCIYPYSYDFTEEGYYAAHCILKLINGSDQTPEQVLEFCNYFNWNRLITELANYDDLKLLDYEQIVTDIANQTFTTQSIKTSSQ